MINEQYASPPDPTVSTIVQNSNGASIIQLFVTIPIHFTLYSVHVYLHVVWM